MKKSLKVKVVY